MPTSTKPRKPRTKEKDVNIQPGRIWTDLSAIHQTCLSQIHATTSVSPILKDPSFIASATDLARVTELAKTIAARIPHYLDMLKIIKGHADEQRAAWDALDIQRKAAWDANDRDTAISYREQQDNVEFLTIGVGEEYQQWNQGWLEEITPKMVELMTLISETQIAMENKANVAE